MPNSIKILIPLYNDWDALELLLERIKHTVEASFFEQLSFVIVDDCSSIPCDVNRFSAYKLEIIRLWRNVSHQKAIALGLSYLTKERTFDYLLVMDSDGEDRPEDMERLYEACVRTNQIVFAKRAKRSEGPIFRVGYLVYKALFGLLTGKVIEFGNFSILPFDQAKKLAYVSEIWNHFPGGVIRSKLSYNSIPIIRGTRLAGKSKMNLVSLILHGLSAISVYLDTVAVRIVISSLVLVVLSILVALVVSIIRLTTSYASPGWATTLVSTAVIVILQAFLSSLFLVFTVLNYRTQKHFIPALEYHELIQQVDSTELCKIC